MIAIICTLIVCVTALAIVKAVVSGPQCSIRLEDGETILQVQGRTISECEAVIKSAREMASNSENPLHPAE